jgi:hypothetical protein
MTHDNAVAPAYRESMFEERPFLATIDQHLEAGSATVTVTLGFLDRTHTGTVFGDADPHHRARMVGEATLRAVEDMTENALSFDLSAVGTSDLGPVRIALAQVRESSWSDYLIGSALVRDGDAATATAKAVLDAINRRIAKV